MQTQRTVSHARHLGALNNGIRELTRQITLEDILNTYQRHDAENGIFDYCI